MKILFLDYGNVARSQIAAAFYNKYSPTPGLALSAGVGVHSHEGESLSDEVINCMRKKKIDLSRTRKKQVTPSMIRGSDRIIFMCSSEELPLFLKSNDKLEFWDLLDTKGQDYEFHEKVRDDIEKRVLEFVGR